MTFLRPGLLVSCIFLINSVVAQQNKIYFNSGSTEDCSIMEVNATTVIYMGKKSSKEKTELVNKIRLIFSNKGSYILPARMDFSKIKTEDIVNRFSGDILDGPETDEVYKSDKTVVRSKISKTDKNVIYMEDGATIPRVSAVAIIYKDGRHEIIGPVEKAADVLWVAFQQKYMATNQFKALEKKDSLAKLTVVDTPKPVPANELKAVDSGTKKPEPVAVESPSILSGDSIPPYDREEFKERADVKIKDFTKYVRIIMDKHAENEMRNNAMDQCYKLFVDENSVVVVSSLNNAPVRRKIKQYLNHIKMMDYDKVEVLWRNVSYVTGIYKGDNGNYYGNITFEQEFKGYKDGVVVYSDVTTKKADVVMKTYEKIADGKTKTLWDVLLGDIGVTLTKSLEN